MIDATSIIDYSYDDFRDGVEQICRQVRQSGYEPDYIVGIVRGGCIPAVHLSHNLKIPTVMVSWNTRDKSTFGNESNTWIPEDLHNGKKILVVDDIVDGGDTIRELLADWHKSTSVLGELPLQNIRIAAMYYNTAQETPVDFYHRTINRDEDKRWIVFHWEA